MTFDMASMFRADLPSPAQIHTDDLPYAFVGGNNDAAAVPFTGLAEAAATVLSREGRNLATYNLGGSALGYQPLRQFVAQSLHDRAAMSTDPDTVLLVSGSLQALDLVNDLLLERGDTVIVEEATYGGMLSRLQRLGVSYGGVSLDRDGLDTDHLRQLLTEYAAQGITPKYIYTIPTVQNPTGVIMSRDRRLALLDLAREFGVPIFEDDCYADLAWGRERPPSIRALDDQTGTGGHVIYCGSFSKSIAPALRVGYLVADSAVISQLLALKTDAGSGSLEQMVISEFATTHFDAHVEQLTKTLHNKSKVMVDAIRKHFDDDVIVEEPDGGIFVWLTFPDGVDTGAFAAAARDVGVEFNPGAGWSADPTWGSRRLRLCFGHPTIEEIEAGVAALAGVYRAHP
ncbi:MAG: 2-aminoadipate transaminase [Acidimicrobiales bacterium]|jgi:2-aminoadipate transaminase